MEFGERERQAVARGAGSVCEGRSFSRAVGTRGMGDRVQALKCLATLVPSLRDFLKGSGRDMPGLVSLECGVPCAWAFADSPPWGRGAVRLQPVVAQKPRVRDLALRRITKNISKAVAGLDLGRCHVARKGRLGGEKGSFKAADQPLADAYRRLPPVAAAYFPMCFFCEKGAVHGGRVSPRCAGAC
ncbi:MAG: hypothetical protein JWR26_3434, partial [Pedosphaera sp.]|nr:hypothetical protein [Pedosphaera sp.]